MMAFLKKTCGEVSLVHSVMNPSIRKAEDFYIDTYLIFSMRKIRHNVPWPVYPTIFATSLYPLFLV